MWRAGVDGIIDFLSRQWYSLTGIAMPQDHAGPSLHDDWLSVIHSDDTTAFIECWAQSISSGVAFEAGSRIHRSREGYCWHLSRAVPVRDGAGRIVSWFGTSTLMDKERREIDTLTRDGVARDRLIATLAHELRTPLAPALLIVAELERDESLPPELLPKVQALRRNIELETQLVSDLTDISSAVHGKLPMRHKVLDLHQVARDALEVCSREFLAKDITVACALDAEAAAVIGDPLRLKQVIWNLLRNAAKFTPQGGRVEIGTRSVAGKLIGLWVKDSGIGIPAAMLTQVFAPFEQGTVPTLDRYGGLGLGLAIARTIVELHLGTLTAESDGVGKGTTLIMQIPLAPGLARVQPEAALEPDTTDSRPLAILLLEDHTDTVVAMEHLLRGHGHRVTSASTACAALSLAGTCEFDLIISDVDLPDQTGWDFIRALRRFCSTPAIVVSGLGTQQDVTQSLSLGFDEHLVKPLDPMALAGAVRRVASRARKP